MTQHDRQVRTDVATREAEAGLAKYFSPRHVSRQLAERHKVTERTAQSWVARAQERMRAAALPDSSRDHFAQWVRVGVGLFREAQEAGKYSAAARVWETLGRAFRYFEPDAGVTVNVGVRSGVMVVPQRADSMEEWVAGRDGDGGVVPVEWRDGKPVLSGDG